MALPFNTSPSRPLPAQVTDALKRRWEPGPDLTKDPGAWVQARLPADRLRDIQPVHLWSSQHAILNSIVTNPSTAVKSCHSAGKSFTSALAACWWVDSHPPGEAFVVTSAPTGDQVKAILWRELSRLHSRANLPGRLNLSEWYINGELVALGRKPNEYEPTAFQGLHARYILVILDEACGIPRQLWDAASTLASGENSRQLAIGNPDDPHSHFARVCALTSWNTMKISAFDTPNFTGEEVPPLLREVLVSRRWVDDRREEWGEHSGLYTSKVLGEFPSDSEDGVVPASWIAACRRADLPEAAHPVHLGVDVGAGGDRTVVRERRGPRAGRTWKVRSSDPEKTANIVMRAVRETGARIVKVDSNGIGWGVCGLVKRAAGDANLHLRVVPVNVSRRPRRPDRFLNLRAEMWWDVARENSRKGTWDLGGVDDAVAAELAEPRYRLAPGGQIIIEAKHEVRKRLGRSTDDADALMLAFWDPPARRPLPAGYEALSQAGHGFSRPQEYDGEGPGSHYDGSDFSY